MPTVVVDSTCLIALDRIGRLDLLPAVFPDAVAPPAVQEELSSSRANDTNESLGCIAPPEPGNP